MSVHMIYYKGGAKMMRPILTRAEYLELRNSARQKAILDVVRNGHESQKSKLVQMVYSCLPNADGSLRGTKTMSTAVGMDVDFNVPVELDADEGRAWLKARLEGVPELVMSHKDELGLLMLERSATKGYHLVFRRREELSQEENLRWASHLLGMKFDENAKDITRVFFTTSGAELLYLDDEIFSMQAASESPSAMPSAALSQPSVTPSAAASQPSQAPHPEGAQRRFPTDFKGIPYAAIIDEYWQSTNGEPVQGERNKRLHQLASNLRAICDNSEEWLLTVMPSYGLSEAEMRSIVHSACKEPTRGSRQIDAIVNRLTSADLTDDEDYEDEDSPEDSSLLTLNSSLKARLPIGLKESLVGVPQSMYMPLLCGVLPIAAAYADQVQVQYCDGNMQRLGLMSIIYGEQASGKSVVKNAVDVWKRQFDEEDALARKREEVWKERRKARKANEKAPEDPHVLIRTVPVTVSCSTLLKRFKNSNGHTLYSFCEELDTLRKTNGAGSWSSKYDIYRLSFDNGEWGQDYNSDQAESGVVNVAYNWTMLGTDGALRKCFKGDNIENGLSSRVLVSAMPDASFAKMPKFGRRSADDEARILEAVNRLRSYSGFVDTPRLRRAIEQWVEEKRVEAAKAIDHVKDTYRKRAAVIGFRYGVVFHLLTGKEKESKPCIDFALLMAEYALQQQIAAFGAALENQYVEARDECQRYGENHSVFDQLAPVFSRDDLRALKPNCSASGLRNIVMRWKKDGWIEAIDRNRWQKGGASQRPIVPSSH